LIHVAEVVAELADVPLPLAENLQDIHSGWVRGEAHLVGQIVGVGASCGYIKHHRT
jgi:hypothetical protein